MTMDVVWGPQSEGKGDGFYYLHRPGDRLSLRGKVILPKWAELFKKTKTTEDEIMCWAFLYPTHLKNNRGPGPCQWPDSGWEQT